jgi:hypothetical protein
MKGGKQVLRNVRIHAQELALAALGELPSCGVGPGPDHHINVLCYAWYGKSAHASELWVK